MEKKNVVNRELAIGIILILTILLIGTSAQIVIYSQELKRRNSDIDNLIDTINRANDQIASLYAQRVTLQNKLIDLNNTVNLKKTEFWLANQTVSQPQGSYSSWNFTAAYAGFVWFKVESSSTTATYIEVKYNSFGVIYDTKYYVGTTGYAPFPILPGNVELRVGNTNLVNGATETLTAIYCY